MFDISLSELMVIGVVALIVIGPERLPKVARTAGYLLGRAQRYMYEVKTALQHEIELDELRQFKQEVENSAQSLHTSLQKTEASLAETSLGELPPTAYVPAPSPAQTLPDAHASAPELDAQDTRLAASPPTSTTGSST